MVDFDKKFIGHRVIDLTAPLAIVVRYNDLAYPTFRLVDGKRFEIDKNAKCEPRMKRSFQKSISKFSNKILYSDNEVRNNFV